MMTKLKPRESSVQTRVRGAKGVRSFTFAAKAAVSQQTHLITFFLKDLVFLASVLFSLGLPFCFSKVQSD